MTVSRAEIRSRARRVRALVLDVDGVLTDAALYYGRRGEELKRFSARDGFAVVTAQAEGLPVAVLSGRVAPPLRQRLADLHIADEVVVEGSRDKAGDLRGLASRLDLPLEALAFMGDDLPDLPALAIAGLAACPADAAPEVRRRCHLVCRAAGGHGAVRELIETVLKAQDRWRGIVTAWQRGAPRRRRP